MIHILNTVSICIHIYCTDTDTQTHRQTDRHIYTHAHTHTRTHTHTDAHTQTDRQTDTHTHIHTYTDTHRHTDAHTPATGGGGLDATFFTATGGGCRCKPVVIHNHLSLIQAIFLHM